MMSKYAAIVLALLLASIIVGPLSSGRATSQENAGNSDRVRFQKQYDDGNYKDAIEGFRRLALDAGDDPLQVGADLTMAVNALQQLGRVDEIDDVRENVSKAHDKNWRLLMAAADSLLNGEHFGFIIAGKFSRGQHRGGGQAVNSTQRDRVRALQLMAQAIPLVEAEPQRTEAAD